jgi:hypothetical protein
VRIYGATTTASWVNPWCILLSCLAQHVVRLILLLLT